MLDGVPEAPKIPLPPSEPEKAPTLTITKPAVPTAPAIDLGMTPGDDFKPNVIKPVANADVPAAPMLDLPMAGDPPKIDVPPPPLKLDPAPVPVPKPDTPPPLKVDPPVTPIELPKVDNPPPLRVAPIVDAPPAPKIEALGLVIPPKPAETPPPIAVQPIPEEKIPTLSMPPKADPPKLGSLTPVREDLPPRTANAKPIPASRTGLDYEEDLHPRQASETFEGIAQQYYGSPAYGRALSLYNRDGGATRDVRVPPLYVLRGRYPDSVPADRRPPAPAPEPEKQATPAGFSESAPPPLASSRPPIAAEKPAAGPTREYVVPVGGETLDEVAQKVLGDVGRRGEILELNELLSGRGRMPAGMKVIVPAGGR